MSIARIDAAPPRDDATMTVWRISVNLPEDSRGVMLKHCRMRSSLSSRGVPLAPARLLAAITPSVSGFSPVKRKPSFPEKSQVIVTNVASTAQQLLHTKRRFWLRSALWNRNYFLLFRFRLFNKLRFRFH
jgi:hypothetical protein